MGLLAFEEQLELANGSISGTYASVGILGEPSKFLWIYNQTDTAMQFSFDGSTDHIALASGASVSVPLGTIQGPDRSNALRATTEVFVKQIVAPSSGSVFVSSVHID